MLKTEEEIYEFQCLPFGLSSAPRVFTKLMKPVMALLRQAGVRCLIYLDDLLIMGQSREEVGNVTQKILFLLQQLGFRVNWEKSQLTPSQRANYLGFILYMLPDNDHIPPRGKDQEDHGIVLRAAEEEEGVSERDLGSHREDVSSNSGDPTSTSLLQRPSEVEERNFCQQPVIRDDSESGRESSGGVDLVDPAGPTLEWATDLDTNPRHNSRNRCITSRLGCSVWGDQDGGSMVRRGESPTHQHARVDGRRFCRKDIRERQAGYSHPLTNGQYNCHRLYQPYGRNQIPQSVTSSLQFVAVVPPEGDHLIGRALTRDVQHSGRCGISYDPHNRVDAGQISVQQCVTTMGLMLDRPVRFQVEQPVAEIRELAPRSLCSSNRCFSDILAGRTRICLPPFLFGRQMPHEGTTRRMYNSPDCPNMEHPAVVPSPTGAAHRLSITSAVTQDALTGSIQQAPPNDVEEPASASRLETVRASHSAGGISTRASALITSGWSKGTNATYQSGWNRWHRWCDERDINPLSCDIKFFLDFLAELFDQGLQHRSINTIRSAVSMTHSQLEGVPIGQHPLVTRLLKGVYNLRPPMPRYSSTWDVGMVTKYLTSLGRNEDLPLKRLSQKLALLMALVEACRTSELKALDLRFKVLKPEGVSLS